jgi:hypothetical protein
MLGLPAAKLRGFEKAAFAAADFFFSRDGGDLQ